MAKPLTKAQKSKALRDQPAIPPKKTQTLVITAEQFMAGIKKLTDGFDSLARLEKIVLAGRNDAPYDSDTAQLVGSRIREVPPAVKSRDECAAGKAPSGPPPLQEVLSDGAQRSVYLLDKAEALRHRIQYGEAPPTGGASQGIAIESYGPAKDAAFATIRNMSGVEACLDFFAEYLLPR